MAGDRLDPPAFVAALELLLSGPAAQVATRFELDEERVRLLPAGLVILERAQAAFGVPLDLVGGGLREGAILEMART
jgi:exopolyphosphatase/guanosine-5'-triphosphate,3'-diphosphate pyrophosphatase